MKKKKKKGGGQESQTFIYIFHRTFFSLSQSLSFLNIRLSRVATHPVIIHQLILHRLISQTHSSPVQDTSDPQFSMCAILCSIYSETSWWVVNKPTPSMSVACNDSQYFTFKRQQHCIFQEICSRLTDKEALNSSNSSEGRDLSILKPLSKAEFYSAKTDTAWLPRTAWLLPSSCRRPPPHAHTPIPRQSGVMERAVNPCSG